MNNAIDLPWFITSQPQVRSSSSKGALKLDYNKRVIIVNNSYTFIIWSLTPVAYGLAACGPLAGHSVTYDHPMPTPLLTRRSRIDRALSAMYPHYPREARDCFSDKLKSAIFKRKYVAAILPTGKINRYCCFKFLCATNSHVALFISDHKFCILGTYRYKLNIMLLYFSECSLYAVMKVIYSIVLWICCSL